MFDPNKYKQIAQQELGQNAFNFNHTANRYALEAEASRLRDKVSSLINDRIKQINSPKKTYQDAVNYWNQNKSLFQKEGAYNVANDIKNDPAKQAEIKAQGYNVEDYLNGLYHAASNGQFRSQREFNQYNSQLKKDISARDKAYKKQHNGLTQDEVYAMQKQQAQANKPKPKGQGVLGNIEGLFKDLGHGVSQRLGETGNELSNIWKAVSDGPGGYTLDNVANATQADIKKRQKADAKRGYSSTLSKEVQRGANRAVDAATLGNMSAYQNAENAKGYGFNTNYANTRQFGKGGATDFLTSGIGYLAPGSASLDLAKGLGLGEKVASKLADKGASNAVQRLAHLGTEGATTGGIFGGMQSIADPNMTLKQRMANVGFNIALGAVADPLLHGIGAGLSKLRKPVTTEPKQEPLGLPKGNSTVDYPLQLPPPKEINVPSGPAYIEGAKRAKNPYTAKFEQLVKNFNDLQAQGKIPPGREEEVAREMWTHMAGPHDPSFDEMLSLANDRPMPTPQQKVDLVRQARVNQKAPVYGVDNITNNLKLKQPMKRAPLQYVGKGSAPVLKAMDANNPEVANRIKQALNPNKEVASAVENISPENGKLHKLTKSEQQRMKNQDAFAANNADPTIPDTSGHIMSKKDVKQSPSGLMDKAKIKLVDNLKPLDWFDKTVEKVTGKKLKPSESSYTLGLNSRGSDMISKQILTKNMVDSKGNVVGKSLKDVTKNLDANTLKAFEDYLVNKHAITRMKRGEKVFPDQMKMSPEKAAQKVKAYEEKYPKFKDLSQAYHEYNKQLGEKWLVDTGILSKKDWEGYLKANPNYVPNNRIFKDIERNMNLQAKRGFANQANPLKKAVGSQRQIVSPIESTIEHTAQYVKTAKRNEVMQTLIKNIKKDPEAFKGWAEIVNTEKAPIQDTLQKEGIDGVLQNINKGFDQKPDLTKGNIVTGIIDGQKVHVKVDDPQLLEALTNLTPKQQNIVVNFFGKITRVMKNLTTGINPVFSLTRNVFRDVPQAYANSKSTNNPLAFAKDLVDSFISVASSPLADANTKLIPKVVKSWASEKSKLYQDFKNVGGGHASPISSDVNLLAQSKRSILPPKQGVIGKTKHVGGKILGGLENLNNAIESAPRLAEFKRFANSGGYDNKIKGLYEANDVTTNFNKYGDVTKNLDAFVPYLNAAVQGLDKLGRQFRDAPKATLLKASAAITIPTIALYALNHNNPNYQQLSNYIKDQNFLIPLPDGSFIKIPKPRELGVMFGSDVERTLRAWADSDPHAFEGFAQYVKEMFWPPTRPITAPLTDIRANKNFMGYPIVPGDLQNLSPKYQYDAQTSEVAKKLGSVFNQSPKQIDYLIKSYGGVLGQLGIPATTKNSTIGDALKKQVTADPVFSNDILSHFYDEKNKLDMAHTDYTKQGAKTPDLNESLRKVFDARGRDISDLRKRLKQALNNNSLTRTQRQQTVRNLQIQINNIAKQTNQLVR